MSILFKWTEDMSVGDETIDNQHQKLLNQVNRIITSISNKSSSEEIHKVLGFFDEYVNEHLTYEEEYMNKIGYPDIFNHKISHKKFIDNYTKFKKDFEEGRNTDKLIFQIENFLGNWWVQHICQEDIKYHKFLVNKSN